MRFTGDEGHKYERPGSLNVTRLTCHPQRVYGPLIMHVSVFGIDFIMSIDRCCGTVCRGQLDMAVEFYKTAG